MPNAKKLPSGSYRCRATWTDQNGERHSKSFTAATKKEAERLAAEYEVSLAEEDDITFRQAAEDYISSKLNVLSPTTTNEYQRIIDRGLPFLDTSVHKITEMDIQRFVNDYASNHSPKTVRNVYSFVVTVIHTVRREFIISTRLPQKRIYEASIPEDDDVKKILAVSGPELKKAVYLAALGPMRRGEVCAVKYEDLKGSTIHVHAAIIKDGPETKYKDCPKSTASDRYISFPPYVIKALGTGKGYIVGLDPMQVYRQFKKACKAAGVRNFRFHDLRHYGASVLHSLGVPDAYIMERGGWETDTVLKSVYRHTLTKEKKEYTEIANKHFEGLA